MPGVPPRIEELAAKHRDSSAADGGRLVGSHTLEKSSDATMDEAPRSPCSVAPCVRRSFDHGASMRRSFPRSTSDS